MASLIFFPFPFFYLGIFYCADWLRSFSVSGFCFVHKCSTLAFQMTARHSSSQLPVQHLLGWHPTIRGSTILLSVPKCKLYYHSAASEYNWIFFVALHYPLMASPGIAEKDKRDVPKYVMARSLVSACKCLNPGLMHLTTASYISVHAPAIVIHHVSKQVACFVVHYLNQGSHGNLHSLKAKFYFRYVSLLLTPFRWEFWKAT